MHICQTIRYLEESACKSLHGFFDFQAARNHLGVAESEAVERESVSQSYPEG